MARYIDEASLKTINQLISRNNKDICAEIFCDGRHYVDNKDYNISIKDQIVRKI